MRMSIRRCGDGAGRHGDQKLKGAFTCSRRCRPGEARALNCSSAWAANLLPSIWHPRPQGEGVRRRGPAMRLPRWAWRFVGDHLQSTNRWASSGIFMPGARVMCRGIPLSPPAPGLCPFRQTG